MRRSKPYPPTFAVWLVIKKRGPVCDRWERSFPDFVADVGFKPSWRHLLIRKNTSGEFGPGNAAWRPARWFRSAKRA